MSPGLAELLRHLHRVCALRGWSGVSPLNQSWKRRESFVHCNDSLPDVLELHHSIETTRSMKGPSPLSCENPAKTSSPRGYLSTNRIGKGSRLSALSTSKMRQPRVWSVFRPRTPPILYQTITGEREHDGRSSTAKSKPFALLDATLRA